VVSMDRIRAYAQDVAREFCPERIILFGSYAHGTPEEDSDVDMLVVMPHSGSPCDAATEIRLRLSPGFPLDLLVRSPDVLQQRLRWNDCFLREVVERGMVLYAAPRAGVGVQG
jgi:uncharacterized protein